MKKKTIISLILTLTLLPIPTQTHNVFASVNENSEYGYIFTTNKDISNKIQLMDCNIDIISDDTNIYYADNIEDIKNIDKHTKITHIAEDRPIELFDLGEETPNDILYSKQWYIQAVNAPSLWSYNIDGSGVKVGIIDTGIYSDHEDFANTDIYQGINTCALIDKSEERLYSYTDVNGHGTGVASIIASNTNNNVGIAGISDKCTIVPICIYDTESEKSLSVSTMLTGLEYAGKIGCDVVNLSLGFSNPSDELLTITNELVNSLTDKGMIIVAASGNKGTSTNRIEYPAMCENVIGVGAIAQSDDEYIYASYSTANESVFITAPGTSIFSASITASDAYSYKSGTSFSAPIISALAAGIKQINHDINISKFKEILKECAIDMNDKGYDVYTGYGRIDFSNIYLTTLNYSQPEKPEETVEPILIATEVPTPIPTEEPTPTPTIEPTPEPTAIPTPKPTIRPDVDIYSELSYDEETLWINCRIQNFTNEFIDATAIIAIYDDNNSLIKIECVYGIDTVEINVGMPYFANYRTAKVFIWENIDNMKPYVRCNNAKFSTNN